MTCVSSGTIEPRGRHAAPDAEVEGVPPHHPPQEQVQPLAGAAGRRPREEVATPGRRGARPYAARRSSASARVEKRSSAGPTSGAAGSSPSRKNPSIDPAALEHLPQHPQQRDSRRRASSGARAPRNRGASADGIERANVGRRPRPHERQQPLDRLQHARDAAERQRRRAEPDDLAVVGARVAPDDLNRIGRRVRSVEAGVETVEGEAEGGGAHLEVWKSGSQKVSEVSNCGNLEVWKCVVENQLPHFQPSSLPDFRIR